MMIFSFEKKKNFMVKFKVQILLTIFFTTWMGALSHLDLVWRFNWFIFQKNYIIVALDGWVGSH